MCCIATDQNKNLPQIKASYLTTTGNNYPLEFGYTLLPSKSMPVDFEATTEACRKGCNLYGRNGGCPPFSPNYFSLCKRYCLILYAKINTQDYPSKVLKGPYYTKWVFVETLLTPLTNKIGKCLQRVLGGQFLSSGHCSSCRPQKCAFKEKKPCRKPKERTFSLEATGIIVTELMKDSFDIELQWWDPKVPELIPEYMIKVIGLTSDENFNLNNIDNAFRYAFDQDRLTIYEYNIFARSVLTSSS